MATVLSGSRGTAQPELGMRTALPLIRDPIEREMEMEDEQLAMTSE